MNKPYKLFYRDTEIGSVTKEDENFPNLFGTFHAVAGVNQGLVGDKMRQYIAYSIADDQLMQEGTEEEWEKFATENESQFQDLIETDDWCLKDDGDVMPILVPRFCQDDGIVWRWNVSLEGEG